MIKVVAILRKKQGLSRQEFLHYWNVEHPEYVRRLPGLRRYRQNPAIDHHTEWPYDGMAELWFDSVRDVAVAYAGTAAEELFAHEKHFLGEMQWFLSEELDIDLTLT